MLGISTGIAIGVGAALGALLAYVVTRAVGARQLAEARAIASGAARDRGGAARRGGGTRRGSGGSAPRARAGSRASAGPCVRRSAPRRRGSKAISRHAVERNALLKTAEETLREAFRALASEALQQNSESMLRLARATLGEMQTRAVADLDKRQQSISEVVKPLVDTLQQVDVKLGQVEMDRATTTAKLDEQIRTLGAGLSALNGQTGDLVKALRQPHVRGHWGELQLKRVVELAGMLDHCDFFEQQTADVHRRPLQARSGGEAAGREADRGRCEGAARRVSRIARSRRCDARGAPDGSRAPGA